MKTYFDATNPDKIEFTMTITMTMGEWREVKNKLTGGSDTGAYLSYRIDDLIQQAEKSFYSFAEPKEAK